MAATIRFLDGPGLEEGIRIFRRYGEALPADLPDTYHVSDMILGRLKDAGLSFEMIDPKEANLLVVTEEMFSSIRQSLEELRAGKTTLMESSRFLKDFAVDQDAG